MTRATRRMGLIVISSAALALASVRLSADDAKVSGDLQKLQGTWVRAGEDGPVPHARGAAHPRGA